MGRRGEKEDTPGGGLLPKSVLPNADLRIPVTTPNRLAREISPYLLQHAFNPVQWWPWGDEAFAEARRRDVPIFLSIGYSTCYWCHVMERESFENDNIAAQMNEHFVCVKVDREERPDVDEIYMAATVMMSGHGGWPMSVFLEPDTLRPFFCGTYYPASDRPGLEGRPTFPRVLQAMSDGYRTQRDGVRQQADAIANAVREHLAAPPPAAPAHIGQAQVAAAVQQLITIFDPQHGGFGKAPKFPQPVFLDFLLDTRLRAGDDATQDAIDQAMKRTLDKMACGGVRDHVGGGFHRYSVDNIWLVPHFEKMLYDNAQLAAVYARAARFYGDPFYEQVARSTIAYVLREMTSSQGGFYSAKDAEVDHHEGQNYLWLPHEFQATLSPQDAAWALRVYGLDKGPNFQDPHFPNEIARSILRLADRPDRLAPGMDTGPVEFVQRLDRINAALYTARSARKQPHLDDKTLVCWNGLMIHALATAAGELEDPTFLVPASKAADFLLANLVDADGDLRRGGRRGGQESQASPQFALSASKGFLEDYAALTLALTTLARATTDAQERQRRIAQALDLANQLCAHFLDESSGQLHDTRADAPNLFVRTRSTHDGATPSGISLALHAMLNLGELAGDPAWSSLATKILIAIASAISESPVGTVNSTRALLRLLVAGGGAGGPAAEQFRAKRPTPPPLGANVAEQPVEIYAGVDSVLVGPDRPGSLSLVIKIAPGYHIVAADAGDSPAARLLSPFRVGIVHGTGVSAYADYPPGEVFSIADADPIRVYTGTLELTVVLEDAGNWNGTPLLSVSYQACSDTECHRPTTVELDISIDRA
jgi:uncharacterized protein